MTDDRALLAAWTRAHDAAAFAELARRHAGMVYGTCRRIVRDHHLAEEVAQECLLALARADASVRASVAGYLHAVAVSRSRDRVRAESARRRREDAVARTSGTAADDAEPTWRELAPLIDSAIAELPDEQRAPLVMHFLEGRSQAEVAAELGCGQATVSRHLALALAALRQRLGATVAGLTLAALAATLTANAAEGAPPTLVASAAKLALAGPRVGGAAAAGGWPVAKLAAALAALAIVAGGALAAQRLRAPRPALLRAIERGDPHGWTWKGTADPGPDAAAGRTCLAAERFVDGRLDVMEVYLASPTPPLWRWRADQVLTCDVAVEAGTAAIDVFAGSADDGSYTLPLPAAGADARWTTVSLPLAGLHRVGGAGAPADGEPFTNLVFSARSGRFWIDNVRIAARP